VTCGAGGVLLSPFKVIDPHTNAERRNAMTRIEVEAMSDMTRREVRITNGVANTLIEQHHMCLDCAIKMAVALVQSQRPEHEHVPVTTRFCSEVCANALREFFEKTLGVKGELVSLDDLPPTGQG
jgi:hypothetical protein